MELPIDGYCERNRDRIVAGFERSKYKFLKKYLVKKLGTRFDDSDVHDFLNGKGYRKIFKGVKSKRVSKETAKRIATIRRLSMVGTNSYYRYLKKNEVLLKDGFAIHKGEGGQEFNSNKIIAVVESAFDLGVEARKTLDREAYNAAFGKPKKETNSGALMHILSLILRAFIIWVICFLIIYMIAK